MSNSRHYQTTNKKRKTIHRQKEAAKQTLEGKSKFSPHHPPTRQDKARQTKVDKTKEDKQGHRPTI